MADRPRPRSQTLARGRQIRSSVAAARPSADHGPDARCVSQAARSRRSRPSRSRRLLAA